MAIQVGFYPNTEVVLQEEPAAKYEEYPEIPTIPSTAQRLMQALEKLDLEKIEKKFTESMDGISDLVNNPNLAPSIQSLKETLQSTHKLIARVDGKVDPLTKNMNKTVKDFGRLANNLDSRVKELTANVDRTLSGLDKTLAGFDKTMTGVESVVSPDAPLVVDLESSLQEISAMSRSIRELAGILGAATREPDSRQEETWRPRIMQLKAVFSKLAIILAIMVICWQWLQPEPVAPILHSEFDPGPG